LSPAERKKFRSRMWLYRRRRKDLTEEQQAELDELLATIPALQFAYFFRESVADVFDTAKHRQDASEQLEELREMVADEPELLKFFATYDRWRDGILAYFDRRESSGPVEGLNNKARVITRRSYGLKDADSLWRRLVLDVNRFGSAIRRSVAELHALTRSIQAQFRRYYI
jgi:transposase